MTSHEFELINKKIDLLLELQKNKALKSKQQYLKASDVAEITGLSDRTILNRSNLPKDDPRYIPSLKMGSRSKYFERKVIERLFHFDKSER